MLLSFLIYLFIILNPAEDTVVIKKSGLSTSDYAEFSPILYKDGVMLASQKLSSDFRNIGLFRMIYCKADQNGDENTFLETQPVSYPKSIMKWSCYPGQYLQASNELFFTTLNKKKGKDKVHRMVIAVGEMNQLELSNVRYLSFNEPQHSYCNPTISTDGKRMILASDKDGSLDLFQYKKETNGSWILDRKLSELEEESTENFPHLIDDNTLAFASDREGGKGKLDLYISKMGKDGLWEEPQNLDYLNSEFDDFNYIQIDSISGYFSSNRDKYIDDIYFFKRSITKD